MLFADRAQETTTTTGAGALTLSGVAPAGFRTLSAAYPSGGSIPYAIVAQTPGEWEVGIGSISGSLLVRSRVLASSNSGQLVVFSSGTKNVFANASASALSGGVVDPDDAGFDIIILAGQSNMAGRGVLDTLVDIADPRVWQFGGASADARYRTIFSGNDPLHNAEGVNTYMSLGTVAAKVYASTVPANRKVLVVPCATGGTYLYAGAAQWAPGNPGGTLYENAIAQANLAVTSALEQFPNSRVVGAFWHQGESDASSGVFQSQYVTPMKALIAGFRARITGAANSWFVIGGLLPEAIANSASYSNINLAHIQVANETSKCMFVAGPSGMSKGDLLHYAANGARVLGARMGLAVAAAIRFSAVDNTAPAVNSAAVANAAPTVVVLTMTETLDASFVPAASAFAVSGHTVSSVAVSGNLLNVTVSAAFVNGEAARTVSYTQPGTNNARDVAGNLLASFTGQAVTNNVAAAATGVTMTGPTTGVTNAASTAFTIGVTPVGSNISGTVNVAPSDAAAGGTFSPTSVNLTNASPTATFTYTPNGSASTRTISVTNNGGLTNPSSISYVATAAATVPDAPTIGTATGGDATVSIAFTAPASNGGSAILDYTATWSGGQTATGASSPLTITGVTNGVAGTVTVKARNAVGLSAASAASNSVTPAAAVVTVRARAGFTSLTEGGADPNWTYTGTGDTAFNATGAVFDKGLAASALGSMAVVREAEPNNSADQIAFCAITGTALLALAGRVMTFVNSSSGVGNYAVFMGGNSVTALNTVASDAGDIMRIRRSAATTLVAEVSKDSGATWTLIYTATGVTTAAVNFQLQILGSGATKGRAGGLVGVGVVAN